MPPVSHAATHRTVPRGDDVSPPVMSRLPASVPPYRDHGESCQHCMSTVLRAVPPERHPRDTRRQRVDGEV